MPRKSDGSGTIHQRGQIWWVKIRVGGRPVYESSKSTKSDAIKLRDRLLAQRHRGELSGGAPDKVLIGELLDDVLKSDIKPSTRYVWEKVIEANPPVLRQDARPAALHGQDGGIPRQAKGRRPHRCHRQP
jgi:hypothetical protein